MAITYEPIATTTSSGGGNISFTSIPATYTDLFLSFVGDTGGITYLRYNNDNGSNYSSNLFWGNGSTTVAARYSESWTFVIPPSSGNIVTQLISIQNYSNSAVYKTSVSRAGFAQGLTSQGIQLWRNTAAINRVDLTNSGTYGDFTATLYGIKAA